MFTNCLFCFLLLLLPFSLLLLPCSHSYIPLLPVLIVLLISRFTLLPYFSPLLHFCFIDLTLNHVAGIHLFW